MDFLLGASIIMLVAWLFVGQPAVHLLFLCRQPGARPLKAVAITGLLAHVLFLASFGYSTTFEGAYNFSGHGRYAETPPYLFQSIFVSLIVSILMLSVLMGTVLCAKTAADSGSHPSHFAPALPSQKIAGCRRC